MLEVLITLVVISSLVVGGLVLSKRYVLRAYWDELFQMVEQEFFTTNVYALASVSAQGVDVSTDVDESLLPEMHHLYFHVGEETFDSDTSGLAWYVETRRADGGDISQREVIYKKKIEFDFKFLQLNAVELHNDDFVEEDENPVEGVSENAVLLTWTGPLAQLSFHFSDSLAGSGFPDSFNLAPEQEHCINNPDQCFVRLVFEGNAGNEKSLFIDLQKGVYKDFY